MDISPVQPISPVEALPPQQQGQNPSMASGNPQAGAWLAMAQTILTKSVKRMVKGLNPAQATQRTVTREKAHAVVSTPKEFTVDKTSIAPVQKSQASETPQNSTTPTPKARESEAISKETPQFSETGSNLTKPELKERIAQAFSERCNPEKLKPDVPRQPLVVVPDSRETQIEKQLPPHAVDRPKEKEKIEDEEPLERKVAREREKIKSEDRDKEVLSSGVEPSPKAPPPPPPQLERLTPQILLGLGLSQDVAERMTGSAGFQSAKVVLIVQSQAEKIVLTHLLQLFGSLKRRVYIWPLESACSFSDVWIFLKRMGMPNFTLMDLELGNKEGGWHRVKFLLRRLLSMDVTLGGLTDEIVGTLPHWDDPVEGMDIWIAQLESAGIYLSAPFDFDHMVLTSYSKAYGLEVEADTNAYYQELFYKQNRLTTHHEALRRLNSYDAVQQMPEILGRLLRVLASFA